MRMVFLLNFLNLLFADRSVENSPGNYIAGRVWGEMCLSCSATCEILLETLPQ